MATKSLLAQSVSALLGKMLSRQATGRFDLANSGSDEFHVESCKRMAGQGRSMKYEVSILMVAAIAMLSLTLIPRDSFAGIPITSGNLPQDACDFPAAMNNRSSINLIKIKRRNFIEPNVSKKLLPIGKTISPGDALFYASFEFHLPIYIANSNIDTKGKGFLTSDFSIPKGSQLYPQGMLIAPNLNQGQGYLLVGTDSQPAAAYAAAPNPWRYYLAIKDDGFVCSVKISVDGRVKGSIDVDQTLIAEATVYQNGPLVKQEELQPMYAQALALTLTQLDELTATIGLKFMREGKVVNQKDIQVDATSDNFDISGLKISFERLGKSSIKITSISEPTWPLVNDVIANQFKK